MKLLTKKIQGPSANLHQEQLDDLSLKNKELEDELEFRKKIKTK